MNEDFLSFVWRFQQYDSSALKTTGHESVTVIRTGVLNQDAGPDFSEARILINDLEWVGNVEIHVRSSDWVLHGHQGDHFYRNVVLHVVWEDDVPVRDNHGSCIPTISLKNRIHPEVLSQFRKFVKRRRQIFPCEEDFTGVDLKEKLSMMRRVATERLNRKADEVMDLWARNDRNWEETAYQVTARYFGFRLNAHGFGQLSRHLPLKTLQKYGNSLFQLEALLFGHAGLIPRSPGDEYGSVLKKEFEYLSRKSGSLPIRDEGYEWKFMRTRPVGFPTIRIAQFAAFIYRQKHIFSDLIHAESPRRLQEIFHVRQSDYWLKHYNFCKRAATQVPELGASSSDSLVINAALPVMFAYARLHSRREEMEKVVGWVRFLPAEKNVVIRNWSRLNLQAGNGFESQALLEWYQKYCAVKKCLDCEVGKSILCRTV